MLFDYDGEIIDRDRFRTLQDGAVVVVSAGGAFKDPLRRPLKFLAHRNGSMDGAVEVAATTLSEALDASTEVLELPNAATRLFQYDGAEILTDSDFRAACVAPRRWQDDHRSGAPPPRARLYASTGAACMLAGRQHLGLDPARARTPDTLGFPRRSDGRTAAESEAAIRILAFKNGTGRDRRYVTWKPAVAGKQSPEERSTYHTQNLLYNEIANVC